MAMNFLITNFLVFFSFFAFVENRDDDFHVRKARMINAETTDIEKYPYVAFGGHCTASIIHQRYILAAKHCYGTDPNDLSFFVGVDDRNNLSMGVQHFAEAVFSRANENISADIALVRLTQPITFNSRAQPLKLKHDLVFEPEENVTVTGFGVTEDGGYSQKLRVGNFSYSKTVNNILYLRSFKNGLATVCFGDSGSPAVIRRSSQCGPPLLYHVGIAWGAGSIVQNNRTLYSASFSATSTPAVCTWLKEKSNNEIEC